VNLEKFLLNAFIHFLTSMLLSRNSPEGFLSSYTESLLPTDSAFSLWCFTVLHPTQK